MMLAFNQAAAKLNSSMAPAAAAPAYMRVQAGTANAPQQGAVAPQQWPPALKAYVERAFKACDLRQRPKLQDVLKNVIGSAQASGELWTRAWEAMPLPDLTQCAVDAAAVLAEVAAVAGPAVAAQGPGQGFHPWPAVAGNVVVRQQDAPQQQKQVGRQTQRRRLDSEGGRHGRRSYRSIGDSSSSDSEHEHWSYVERQRRKRRAGRFADARGSGKPGGGSAWKPEERRLQLLAMLEEGEDEDVDWDALAIKGTCQELEKSYFRLTSAPDPATVRPEPVLRLALDRLVALLRTKKVNYFYALDQFKGMRQDCTVQHIRNELVVQVYEAHARAALEYGDSAEFNQCQAQLRVLYNEGVHGSRSEFLSYRILYQAIHARHGEILQLLNTLKKVNQEEAAQPRVAHALAVRAALAAADYPRFFCLYHIAPGLGRALMDIYVPKLRFEALQTICKAFKPTVPLPFLAAVLGFVATAAAGTAAPATAGTTEAGKLVGSQPRKHTGAAAGAGEGSAVAGGDERAESANEPPPGCKEARFEGEYAAQVDMAEGCRECIQWLGQCGAVVLNAEAPQEATLDCKASAGHLKMPSPVAKVAHDDMNLTVDDFLKGAMAS